MNQAPDVIPASANGHEHPAVPPYLSLNGADDDVHLFDWWTSIRSNTVPHRRHSAEVKVKVLAACNEPGASIAAVALSHGLKANLVRKWLVGPGLKRTSSSFPFSVLASKHSENGSLFGGKVIAPVEFSVTWLKGLVPFASVLRFVVNQVAR
jgi:hypothetical protein